jgi:hypothetical protein
MGLGTKTYWLTERQSQCNFDFDFVNNSSKGERFMRIEGKASPRGGEFKYLHVALRVVGSDEKGNQCLGV